MNTCYIIARAALTPYRVARIRALAERLAWAGCPRLLDRLNWRTP